MALTTKFIDVNFSTDRLIPMEASLSSVVSGSFSITGTSALSVSTAYGAINSSEARLFSLAAFSSIVTSSVLYTVPSGRVAKIIYNSGAVHRHSHSRPSFNITVNASVELSYKSSLSQFSSGGSSWGQTILYQVGSNYTSSMMYGLSYNFRTTIIANGSTLYNVLEFAPGGFSSSHNQTWGSSFYSSGPKVAPITFILNSANTIPMLGASGSVEYSASSVSGSAGAANMPYRNVSLFMGPGQSIVVYNSFYYQYEAAVAIFGSFFAWATQAGLIVVPSGYVPSWVASMAMSLSAASSISVASSYDWSFIVIEESGS